MFRNFRFQKQPCSNEQNPVSSQTMNMVVVEAPSVSSNTYIVYIRIMLLCTYNIYIYILCRHKRKRRLCQDHKINTWITQCPL